MAQNYRNSSQERGNRPMRSGPDRDPYRAGDERRYQPDRGGRERGFEGDRSYSTGGYSEEQGYRRENRNDWSRDARNQREHDYWRNSPQPREERFGREGDEGSRDYRRDRERAFNAPGSGQRYEDDYRRGQFRGRQTRGYGEYSSADLSRGWSNLDTPAYYGTGNYAGSYSSGPGSRASEDGVFGPSSNQIGQSSWNDPNSDWVPESSARRGTDTDYSRDTSGDYANYGRSEYGSQSSYGRSYGDEDSGNRWQDDWRGSHRGRGPKGYARSDERLREMICERLTDDPRIDASEIDVEVTNQKVKLTGSVPDRRTKYEVEDLVEHCGAQDIDNQLRVQSSSRWGSRSSENTFRSTVQSGNATQSGNTRYDYSGSSNDAQSGSAQAAGAAGRSSDSGSAATSTSSSGPSPGGTAASASAPGTSPGASKRDNRSS
jgi:osmotically-inducible protein OsmY